MLFCCLVETEDGYVNACDDDETLDDTCKKEFYVCFAKCGDTPPPAPHTDDYIDVDIDGAVVDEA